LERLSQFHNSVAFITDMNALRHTNFCSDQLLANDSLVRRITTEKLASQMLAGGTLYRKPAHTEAPNVRS
jgi:hypothetical protein